MRSKAAVKTVKTIEEAEQIMAAYAKADARLVKINAVMDEQFTAIRANYSDEKETLQAEKDEAFDRLQAFSESNPDYFAKRKSIEMSHGILGFRTGTPKLKTLPKFSWAAVTELLKARRPEYVRISSEPDKEKLLADRKDVNLSSQFKELGIKVVQEESFFIELKKEE